MAAWGPFIRERFPAAATTLLVGLMALASAGVAAEVAGGPVVFWPVIPVATVAIVGAFFVLRVFDEHKDFDRDREAHPNRVLSRGLITLADLARAGVGVAVVSLGLSAWLGLHAALWMVAALVFATLMRFEFFIGDWLRDHIIVYAVTHNPVVALLMMVPVAGALGTTVFAEPIVHWLVIASLTTLALEVGRKFRAPGDERPTQDTYTQALGIKQATTLYIVIVGLVLAVMTVTVGVAKPYMIAVDFAAAGAAGAALSFARSPTAGGAKQVELATALLVLLSYGVLIGDLIARRGFAWS